MAVEIEGEVEGGFGRGGRQAPTGRGCGMGHGRGGCPSSGGRLIAMLRVNMQCFPSNINPNSLSFSNEQWYIFTNEQTNAVNALHQLRNTGWSDATTAQASGGDDVSSLGHSVISHNNGDRHLHQSIQLPPAPSTEAPNPPTNNANSTANSNKSTGAPVGHLTREVHLNARCAD